ATWFYRQGQLSKSQATLLQAIELDPEFFEAYNRLGLIFLEQGKRPEAILHFQQALKVNPDYEQARLNLSRAMLIP
ncbi:MAG TPA: tetratricopeptide repeat protein, partial [Planctomycetaceae bacterium]|nr:tetratricopeptide repeat protein [Planctomycetaceae bacterium]